MLKKGRSFWAILAIVFSFSVFGGLLFNLNPKSSVVFASEAPSLDTTKHVEGEYIYNLDEIENTGELTLINANWTTQLDLSKGDLTIILNGESTIRVEDGFGITLNSNNLTITGFGEFIVYGNFGALDLGEYGSISLRGIKAYVGEGSTEAKTSLSADDVFEQTYIKFVGEEGDYANPISEDPSEDPSENPSEEPSEHKHSFTYNFTGAKLVATCSSADCTLDSSQAQAVLSVSSVDFGQSPTVSIDFANFNAATGNSLSSQSYETSFYKTETENATEGGMIIDTPANAGFYYAKLNFNAASGFEGKSLVCAFTISKIDSTIVGKDKTITYQEAPYDVSQMFEIGPDAGLASYEIVTGGTGEGTLDKFNLTITKCGTILIKVTTTGTENYNGTELTKTLTIEKMDMKNVVLVLDDWDFDKVSSTPGVINNISGGKVTFTYWKNEELTTPCEYGAMVQPTEIGVYYIKATIAETEFYKEKVLSKKFTIWGKAEPTANPVTVKFDQLTDSRYDVSSMFVFDENCGAATYFLIESETGAELPISGTMLDITEVGSYVIKAKYESKGSYRAGELTCELLVEKANLAYTLIFDDWTFGETPRYYVDGNTYNAAVSIKYYLDEAHENLVTENDGVPTSVGTYYAVVTVAETDYSIESSLQEQVNILSKDIEIIWDENNFTYNGEVQEIKASFVDVNGETVYLNVSVNAEFKHAGSYIATASFAESQNSYTLPSEVTKNYTLHKRELILQINDSRKYYSDVVSSTLSATIIEGKIVRGENAPYSLHCDVDADSAIGEYPITGTTTNEDYEITFNNGKFTVLNKVIGNYNGIENRLIVGWTYGETAKVPSATTHYGTIVYKFALFTNTGIDDSDWSTTVPSEPGEYWIRAEVVDEKSYNCAYAEDIFTISKIKVDDPAEDKAEYIYNGFLQTYKLEENSTIYTISNRSQKDAGTYVIRLELIDSAHYTWTSTSEAVLKYSFVIKKKLIEKPAVDSRILKYTGKPITYNIPQSGDYNISNNITQTNVGRYIVTVTLKDIINTEWKDNSINELYYDFVINQNKIDLPTTKDIDGTALETSPVTIIETGVMGLSPETKLEVLVIDSSNKKQIKETKNLLKNSISNYDRVFRVYDVTLNEGGTNVQPNGFITLKMEVPKELRNTKFRLYHIHTNNSGEKVVSEIDYNSVDENGYITFQVDSLSEFAFAYEQDSLVWLIVTFSIVVALLLALAVLQIVLMIKNKQKKNLNKAKNTVLASGVPVFFFASEVTASIVLGVLTAILIGVNIALFVISKKSKKDKPTKTEK